MMRILPFVPALVALLCGCGGDTVAGGGSERPNPPAFTADTYPAAVAWYASMQGVMYAVTADSAGYAWQPVDTLVTDSTGAFTLQELAAGHYAMVVTAGGLSGFSGYFAHDTVTVIDSIILAAPRTINGIIYDSSGIPAENVLLGLVGTAYFDTVRYGENGRFLFPAVPAGDFKMEIRALSLRNAGWTDSVDAVDSLIENPDAVMFSNDYISVPGAAPAGTSFVSGYGTLPLYSDAVDTVTGTDASIEVANDAYRIEISTY